MPTSNDFPKSIYNTVKRNPDRGRYDKKIVYKILKENALCHVSFVFEGKSIILPTLYGFDAGALYFHGALSNRMLKEMIRSTSTTVAVTQLDALVLARSAFHHSLNYHSLVLFGTAELVENESKIHALKVISDQLLPGRWEECRQPSHHEIKITKVVKLTIESASAKIRTGPPIDEDTDYQLPYWAGLVPLCKGYGEPVVDPKLEDNIPLPESIKRLVK